MTPRPKPVRPKEESCRLPVRPRRSGPVRCGATIKLMKLLLFTLMLAGAAGFAQPVAKRGGASSAAPQRWPIASIAVEGNRMYTTAQVLAVAGLKVGQTAGKSDFEAARDRLVACGAFENVS